MTEPKGVAADVREWRGWCHHGRVAHRQAPWAKQETSFGDGLIRRCVSNRLTVCRAIDRSDARLRSGAVKRVGSSPATVPIKKPRLADSINNIK